jgi:serine/threonine-protein kinase
MAALTCPACATEVPPGGRFCTACGAALGVPTADLTGPYQPPPASAPPALTPPPSGDGGRFTPGQTLAGRYRIVALLGRGGMGEVYRADDLTLGQPVALKFLPPGLAADAGRLARFRGEVRIAREVSHPNVCRVYDIGECSATPGAPAEVFLTMEYIDGEDLAALLKKVGRLPEDKGVEIACQICRGLAAAHERGIIHRDLKPANVMLDGRAQVRITDFGLASFAGDLGDHDVRAGTPAYQAPEQLAGREVTARSDLFALGLILYEVFTGKRAFPANSRRELLRLHEAGTPGKPSSHVTHLDPAVEGVILRCLAADPKDRPRSALAVLAGLPGGDPLQAALAAGETPLPGLVADAPVEGSLRPWAAAGLLAVFLAGLVILALLADRVRLFRKVPFDKPPQELAYQARGLVERLGVTEPAAARHGRLYTDMNYLRYLRDKDKSPARLGALSAGQPAAMFFWYRQSPQPLVPVAGSAVTIADPPATREGMVSVGLDLNGRLLEFHAAPARDEVGPASPGETAWEPLFVAAGLDLARFQRVDPRWLPPVYADERAAWEGAFPGQPQTPLRVEAAAYRGRPVYFQLAGPWGKPRELALGAVPAGMSTLAWFQLGLAAVTFLGGGLLAYRNARRGRGDARGAWLLAGYYLAVRSLLWAVTADHVFDYGVELRSFCDMLGGAVYVAAQAWLAYFALEPYVRRRWPWRIVSWQRVLSGRLRDPLVGRDVLVGCAAGVILVGLAYVIFLGPTWWGEPADPLGLLFADARFVSPLEPVLGVQASALFQALTWFFLLCFLVWLVRREWLAVAIVLVLYVAVKQVLGAASHPEWAALIGGLQAALGLFLALRYGLLALTVGMFVGYTVQFAPITLDWSGWYVWHAVVPMAVLTGLAVYGFVVSLGGRPLFRPGLLGDE